MKLNSEKWQELLKDSFQGKVAFDCPMKNYTYAAIGGPADVLLSPDDPLSLRNVVVMLREKNIPFISLGNGTNVLVRDNGIEGVVIQLKSFTRIEVLKEGNNFAELFVETGVSLQRLVQFCREKGYAGIEGLAGIPGTVGGAICGNAGSFGYEMKDVIVSAAIMDARGRLDRYKAAGLGFGYRTSEISAQDVVLSANLKLKRDEREAVSGRTENFLREKREKQPLGEKSLGCVFKNPEGKMSAGRLIDEAGCKGMNVGGIQVSTVHANFFVNTGNGTASDYMNLMEEVSSIVRKKSGITLEPEIRVIGRTA